jgi:hypothetical protein
MRYIAWLHDVAVTTRQLAEKTNQLMAMTE